jgi:hypothetical protein
MMALCARCAITLTGPGTSNGRAGQASRGGQHHDAVVARWGLLAAALAHRLAMAKPGAARSIHFDLNSL